MTDVPLAATVEEEPSRSAPDESREPLATLTPSEPLAAVVNGQSILLRALVLRVAEQEDALLEQGLDANSAGGQAQLEQLQREALESLIDYVLIEQAAPGLGVTLSEEDLEAQVTADIEAGGGQASFDEWLEATGQTRGDYKAALRESMLVQRVFGVVTSGMPDRVEQVHARHILVGDLQTAEQVLARLQAGEDFAAVAAEASLDAATKEAGGDLGWFPRGAIAAELEEPVFGLKEGEISTPVPVGEGYHILQVIDRDRDRPLTPEVWAELAYVEFEHWLSGLRARAVIERFVENP